MGTSARALALSNMVMCFAAHATCVQPDQSSKGLYGRQRDETSPSMTMVCSHSSRSDLPQRAKASKESGNSQAMRLDAMDKEGVILILCLEFAITEAELPKTLRLEGGDPKQTKERIHRLGGDIAALQAELVRAGKM